MDDKTLRVPFFWDGVRRGVFALALAMGCMIVQDEALPSSDFMNLVTGICMLMFGLSVTARPWFVPRICLGVAVGVMTMNVAHMFDHDRHGMLAGAILLGLAASVMRRGRALSARLEVGRVTQGETVAARW